ncbi:MAG TPA: hypothetical protein VKB93_10560 [Thermoanaerobaculia bacterium]|nr:hypothetical protein [Thermoanaerobaculia bacterium]
MRLTSILFLALSLAAVRNADAQELIYAEAMPPVSVFSFSSLPPAAEGESRAIEQHERHSALELWLSRPLETAAAPPTSVPTITAPPMKALFKASAETNLYPADAAGAVGRNHVVGVTNQLVTIHKRTGEVLASSSVRAFMGGATENVDFYDSRIAYDAASDRWVLICLRAGGTDVVVAVSQTGDPAAAWSRYRINYTQIAPSRVDYSHIAMTRDSVVFSMYAADLTAAAISIRKNDLYASPATLPITKYYFPDVDDVVPAENDESGVEYMVSRYGVKRLDRFGSPWVTTKHAADCACGFPFSLPQQGSTTGLDPGYGDIDAVVYRGGAIYAVRTTGRGNPFRDVLWWWKADAETGDVLDEGLIDDQAGGKSYAYPSLAVNHAREMLIGFGVFANNMYASAGYLFRDAAGRISTIASIKSGNAPYTGHTDSFSGAQGQRWGDYTTTVLDPASDNAFWTIQLVTEGNRWSAWWANVEVPFGRRRSVKK